MRSHIKPQNIDLIGAALAGSIPGLMRLRVARSSSDCAYSEHAGGLWQVTSWQDLAARVDQFRIALDEADLEPGDRVAIMLPNCIDWITFDLAAMSNGLTTVPLYPHDSVENLRFILSSTGAIICLVDKARMKTLMPALADRDSKVREVLVRDGANLPEIMEGVSIRRLADVLDLPYQDPGPLRCRPDDIATIIHTSGTTGQPKGVMLTHRALLWNAAAVTEFVPPLTTDVFLSLLPLAHAFEQTLTYHLAMMGGAHVAFARGIPTLRQDLVQVRPTVLVAVPRLYEQLHDAILRKTMRSPIRRWLMHRTAEVGWSLFEARRGRAKPPGRMTRLLLWPLLDRLVASQVREAFGGRLRVAVSGGAALSTDVSHFLVGLGLPMVEGYGLTEAAPVVTATTLEDSFPGSVGRPLNGIETMLGDEGELLVRTPALMQGYWAAPSLTSEAIDAGGWLHTGDIAEVRNGRVFITGRQKEIIVLSTGKNVASAAVETAIMADPLIEQCCVLGDGRPSLIAVVTLENGNWTTFAAQKGLDLAAPNAPGGPAALLLRIARATENLPGFGKPRSVHAVLTPWTVEDGFLTPTLKVKRRVVAERYHDEISALYSKLSGSRDPT
jgi:long-chain acyl-CoA synthetase